METPEEVTLANIGEGVVPELFQRELKAVLENMADINTEVKVAREINIKFKFMPTEQRDMSGLEISCQSKLVGAKSKSSSVFVVHENNKIVGYQMKVKQQEFDLKPVSIDKNIGSEGNA